MSVVAQIGFKAVELIEEQIKQGIDAEGKKYSYSTKPFVLPAGKKKFAKMLFDNDSKSYVGKMRKFTTKQGKLWYLVHGGYRSWRELNNRNPDGDFLQWSGQMLRSLSSKAESPNTAIIYFADAESAKRAFWFNISGVGRSRKLWRFLGLTKENERKLLEYAAEIMGKNSDEVVKKIIQDFEAV